VLSTIAWLLLWQELHPTVGDLRYAVLHGMLLTVTKNPPNVQKALKNFIEILNVDVRLSDCFNNIFTYILQTVKRPLTSVIYRTGFVCDLSDK